MSARFRRLTLLAPTLVIIVTCFAGLAQGQTTWTQTANSCVVDNSDLDQYDQDSFSLQFRRGVEGTILARCNVTNPRDDGGDPGWGTLEVVFRDPDGSDDRSRVRVRLFRVNNGGNTTEIAELDSDDFPEAHDPATQSVSFSHAFDFDHGAYFVELRVSRESIRSENNPAVFLVRLAP